MSSLAELKQNGNELFSKGNYVQAIEAYGTALDRFGPDPVLLSNRAQCWIKVKKWENAREDAEQGLAQECTPKIHVKLLYRLGVALRALGRDTGAERCFHQLLQLEPANQYAKTELSQSYVPLKKKLRVLNDVVVPLEVVDVLPDEYLELLRKLRNHGLENLETLGKDAAMTTALKIPILKTVKQVSEELFGARAPIVKAPIANLTKADMKSTYEKVHGLDRLREQEKLELWRKLQKLDSQALNKVAALTGVSTEFLEFCIDSLRKNNAKPEEVRNWAKILSKLPRYHLALLMCDTELLSWLNQYNSTASML